MKEMVPLVKTMSDKIMLPISILVLIGYIMVWAIHVADKSDADASEITKIETRQEQYTNTVIEINDRLARIEGALKLNRGNQ